MATLSLALGLLFGSASALPTDTSAIVKRQDIDINTANNWDGPKGRVDTLLPAVHWRTNQSDLEHLTPAGNHDLYYTRSGYASMQYPDLNHMYANINSNWNKPAIVLEHSNQYSNVECLNNDSIQVTFNTQRAFNHAQNAWPSQGDFLVVSHTSSCAAENDGQRAYFDVSAVQFGDLTATLTTTEVDISQVVDDMGVAWGSYTPSEDAVVQNTSTTPNITQSDKTSCGKAPAPTISGFPAAGCYSNFDSIIDNAIGYLNFSGPSDLQASLEQFAPGLSSYNASLYDSDSAIQGENVTDAYDYDDADNDDYDSDEYSYYRRRSVELEKRCCHISLHSILHPIAAVQHLATEIKQKAVATYNTVKAEVVTAYNDVKAGVKFIEDGIKNGFDPSVNTNIPIHVGPSNLVDSPFGPAFELYSKEKSNKKGDLSGNFGLYCVDCGVNGQAHVAGHLAFSVTKLKITSGNLTIDGNLKAGINLGLAADVAYTPEKFVKHIAQVGLPGFSIPKVIIIGPEVALDAALGISVTAHGEVLIGATATIPDFHAFIDVMDIKNYKATGFKPIFNTTFNASAQIQAQANLGTPLSIGVGIDLPLLKNGRKMLALSAEPEIQATLAIDTTSDTCKGVSYGVSVGLEADVDLFGLSDYKIFSFSSPNLASGCLKVPTSKPTTTAHFTANISSSYVLDSNGNYATPKNITIPSIRSQGNAILKNLTSAASANEDTIAAGGQDNQDGFNYTTILDSTSSYILTADKEGNMRLAGANQFGAGITWAAYETVIGADANNRILHYYPDTMKTYGVSRFRISYANELPKTSDVVSLVPLNLDSNSNTPGVYMAVDSEGGYYYTLACNFEDGKPAKLFLANNATMGATTLQGNGDLRYIVSGGDVKQCSFVALVASGVPGIE